ncbi:MAG TPA: SlyX family protein [Planctomycetaceae bacterium]|nr:SlyX family protein [Planctomycetaceae bacterium]
MEELERRTAEVEFLMTHLQRDLEALSQVVLEQRTEIERLRTMLNRFEHRIGNLETDPEVRDPGQERPPHY